MTSAAEKKLNLERATNFMRQYRDPQSRELKKLSANQFMEVWSHYDKDGNGYIEGTELDGFLREFVSSANAENVSPEAVSDAMLVELKQCFMEAYDDNQDGKIDIRELAQLLPMEENFLLLFRFDNPLESSVEFMKIWREYDTDGSGYIEADELKNFLRDLLKEAKKINDVSEDKLIEYTDTMLQVFDANKDGRLKLSEMAKDQIEQANGDAKRFWGIVNEAAGRPVRKQPFPVQEFADSNDAVTPDHVKSISNSFNNYFASVGVELATALHPDGPPPVLVEADPSQESVFRFQPVTGEQITEVVRSIRGGSAPGLDNISAKFLAPPSGEYLSAAGEVGHAQLLVARQRRLEVT
ncbi:calbindin-32-like [Macrosteles quadrilineatus]|uniref:calbindin-32-like n=1 Tax=Macrosteles quadrilineatus TaxID=74068 RepID=UPI0023E1AB45|nr:calbindin-32-like [Macrosteles quadrilineatus]